MKYRTVIEIITDADNQYEAADIAGEFLQGDFENGTRIKCRTYPLRAHFITLGVLSFFFVAFFVGVISTGCLKSDPTTMSRGTNVSAVQPPLKTARASGFRKTWQGEEARKAFERAQNK